MERVRQLLGACEHGEAPVAQTLLDEGVDVDCEDDEVGITPLQTAAANGHDHIVRLLLMRGAALNKTNNYGWTPLMHASRNGHANVVATLLQQRQADINAITGLGASALTFAARGGHIQVVRQLVEAGIELSSSGGANECDFTPLLAAALYGHDAVLRFLLDRGCDVNFRTSTSGLTPLMVAALNGHMKTAQILVERGADPNVTNANNRTALDIATMRMKREVAAYLDRKTTNKPERATEEKKPDIIEAIKFGDIKRIQAILDQDLSQRDACSPEEGATPLMFASMAGQLDIAQLLVDHGCDMDKQDTISGWTALMQATYHGRRPVAMYLIEKGADVTIQAKNGCTAFDMASLIDDVDTDLLRLLASKAMTVNKVDKSKKHWSKQNGVSVSASTDSSIDDTQKTGLRGWLSRLSNRFRNIKKINVTNRLAPMPTLETSISVQDLSFKNNSSPTVPKKVNNFVDPIQTSSVTNYGTMTLENKQSASRYTLDINPMKSSQTSDTLKPVIPPFLPQPSFAIDESLPGRRSMSTLGSDTASAIMPSPIRPMMKPMKFLPQKSTTLSSSPISPSSSAQLSNGNSNHSNPSPSSSGEYQQNGVFWNQSNKSPGIFAPRNPPQRQFFKKPSTVPSAFKATSNTTSPNSSTSGSSSITPQRSLGRSTSSKGSTTSTLTPSPSPTPGKYGEDPNRVLSSLHENDGSTDELSGILKKLSLEKYQPIFEEQEVDMEAFLTLTDTDLNELGITQTQAKNQILTAITELNTGKGKDRQQFIDTMTSFQTTLKARSNDSQASLSSSRYQWREPSELGNS
ncbi:ankyrin repeat and SAM domain-containing protein 6-like [Saccostrea echinata]|uniref:ankyrin repeat and SAM domain-containing protein 6-like n=1 Tax=Saccostrea echinata TaxID=191078 RepID=UPI002A83079B|nr:ankyrin repeat and SAM domain-containing protein 6-like [Saccostrea echinata]